jgi:uncharacterized protein
MIKRSSVGVMLAIQLLTGHADTLSDALAARARGDHQTAYPLWVKLSEQGDHRATIELGLMHHRGIGVPKDGLKAMDWYLKVFQKNGDAVNNIGVLFRDGEGVPQNRQIAFLLFLTVHMTGMGNEGTVMRANGNLRREISELPKATREEALCYTLPYVVAYVESRGQLQGVPEALRASPQRPRIKDLNWWMPGEVGEFSCPPNT